MSGQNYISDSSAGPVDQGQRPTWPFILLPVLAALWLTALALAWRTPPIDNVEQWVWLHAPQWGYYKHPPLPTWLAAAAAAAFGATPALLAGMGAACVMGAAALQWALLRRLLGAADAAWILLAVLCLTYSTQRLDYYNHNVLMMPLTAGVVTLLWRVTQRPAWGTWAAIGALLGLGMLVKYQMGVVALCVTGWWLYLRGWRQPGQRAGLLLAATVAAAVFAPHVAWLLRTDFAPFHYASQSSLGAHLPWLARPGHAAAWVLDWLGNRLAPAWVLLATVALWGARAWRRTAQPPAPALAPSVRAYLLLWGLGPMLLMVLLGLLGGIGLQKKWSTAFALWTVPALWLCVPPRLRLGARLPRVAWVSFAMLQAALLLHLAVSARAAPASAALDWRQRDFAAAGAALAPQAQAALGGPVQVINGPYGMAGALAQRLPGPPRVLIDGDPAISPWVDAAALPGARIVSVWPACKLPAGAQRLMPGWAWWPRAEPPLPAGVLERRQRLDALRHGGAAPVLLCP